MIQSANQHTQMMLDDLNVGALEINISSGDNATSSPKGSKYIGEQSSSSVSDEDCSHQDDAECGYAPDANIDNQNTNTLNSRENSEIPSLALYEGKNKCLHWNVFHA